MLKAFVQDEYHIPMTEQQLYLGDKLMLDPLTLLDYAEVANSAGGSSEIFVKVEGVMGDGAKK